ncbi:cob(I)yrinic acid a,c-diamide adenosyltransferase [Patescibacteria group bacterium]|nr:cob(I)yrinic acid a,c-diamide adenosyltransferase [Patescibacteria group bacterium]MBU1921685.1 cob(I)yrinic acid a,c-diamide adenosyltransferase [Patescibacteria group bacterium]
MRGFIHVYTGDGKGKTTAAIGLAMRAVKAGKRVAIVFFDKAGDFYSERKLFDEEFAGRVEYWVCGRPRFNPEENSFDSSVTEQDKWEARKGIEMVRDVMDEGRHQVLVLDEVNNVLHQNLVEAHQVLDLISQKPENMELILTGRNAAPEVMEAADLVTDMRNVKHYMEQGVMARKGIDY